MEKRGQDVKSICSKIKEVFNPFLLGEIKKIEGEVFEVFDRKGTKKGEVELGGDGVLRYFNNKYKGLIFLLINKGIITRKLKEQLLLNNY